MEINIPCIKKRKKDSECVSNTLKYIEQRKNTIGINKDNYIFKVAEELAYYPYWILEVNAFHVRPFHVGSDAKRTWYITCDAIDEDFIVLQNIPKLKSIDVREDRILEEYVSEKRMYGRVLNEAVEDRINRQFIFGKPRIEAGFIQKIYLPVLEIKAKRKDEIRFKTYFANIYTGEIKA